MACYVSVGSSRCGAWSRAAALLEKSSDLEAFNEHPLKFFWAGPIDPSIDAKLSHCELFSILFFV